MDKQQIEMWLMSHQGDFAPDKIMYLRDKFAHVSEETAMRAMAVELKNPTTMFLISLFLGVLGVDRFMLGDTGMGVLKLLTGGVCGIMALVDLFSVSQKAKELNFNNVMTALSF